MCVCFFFLCDGMRSATSGLCSERAIPDVKMRPEPKANLNKMFFCRQTQVAKFEIHSILEPPHPNPLPRITHIVYHPRKSTPPALRMCPLLDYLMPTTLGRRHLFFTGILWEWVVFGGFDGGSCTLLTSHTCASLSIEILFFLGVGIH